MKRFALSLLKGLGAVFALLLVVFIAGVFWPISIPTPNERPDRLVISGATIVNTETGVLVPGQSILIEGDKIVSIDNSLPEAGVTIIDARGQYAIPGMFDMHAHSFKMSPELMHPLFVASGVTAIRDMGGCMTADDSWAACADDKRAWTAGVEAAQHVGPRYDHITGLQINGGHAMPSAFDVSLGGTTPEGARKRVRQDHKRGLDFLKTYSKLPKDSYFALADEATKRGMYLAGHLPFSVSASEAIAAGQRSFEHGLLFLFECYPEIDELRLRTDFFAHYTNEKRAEMLAQHDTAVCQNLFAQMQKSGTAFVPTHTTRKMDAYAANTDYRGDPRLTYVPGPLKLLWSNDADGMAQRGEGTDSYLKVYEFGLKQTGLAHKAGVTVLAGTDAPDSYTFAGFSLADELQHLVDAGLSPAEALKSATYDAADFLGLRDQAGVIKPGGRADIVLLAANPLEDIGAVRRVNSVVLAGAPYDREALNEMLSGVESTAGSWSMWPKFIWQTINSPIMLKQFAD